MASNQQNGASYEREMGAMDTRIKFMEQRVDKVEINISNQLKEVKDLIKTSTEENEKSNNQLKDKIDEVTKLSVFAKGFIRAVLFAGSIITVGITIALKYIK